MSLKTIAGRLLVTAGRKLAAACQCCSPPPPPPPPLPGCCIKDGKPDGTYTDRESCERCEPVSWCYYFRPGGPDTYGAGCIHAPELGGTAFCKRPASSCGECPPGEGFFYCADGGVVGGCGEWVQPCPLFCVTVEAEGSSGFVGNCKPPPLLEQEVVVPLSFSLPVLTNITGSVNDDLLLDGQSITTDLMLDPGPYPDNFGTGCVGAHNIGGQPGPYADSERGGITFPMNKRSFTVAVADTVGFGYGVNIHICFIPATAGQNPFP